MKTNQLNLKALSQEEAVGISGGNPFWIGVAVGILARGGTDFINGVYEGFMTEIAKPRVQGAL